MPNSITYNMDCMVAMRQMPDKCFALANVIKSAPAISPDRLRERGHIVWKDRRVGGYKYIQCPQCKKEIETEHPIDTKYPYCSRCGSLLADSFMNYCPSCGARMDLEG